MRVDKYLFNIPCIHVCDGLKVVPLYRRAVTTALKYLMTIMFSPWKQPSLTASVLVKRFISIPDLNHNDILERCQETPDNENVVNETSSSSSCQYWTFYPSLSKCFILETCNENDDPDAESGKRDCPPGVNLILIHNIVILIIQKSFGSINYYQLLFSAELP